MTQKQSSKRAEIAVRRHKVPEHAEEAANLRALLNIRCEELFHAY